MLNYSSLFDEKFRIWQKCLVKAHLAVAYADISV